MDQRLLEKLGEIVEANLNNDQFTVEDLAKEAGMSRSSLHRKLEQITGQSTTQFIREYRLKKAHDLLVQKAGTVSEIAFEVGFSSATYFSKSFSEFYGYAPNEASNKEAELKEETEKGSLVQPIEKKHLIAIVVIIVGMLSLAVVITGKWISSENYSSNSIAVLPLENLTGSDDQSNLVDGFHDALIGELGKLADLQVISRTSTLRFKNTEKDLREIASILKVNNILEGSVFQVGDSIRVQLQLIQVHPNERHIWAEDYGIRTQDVFSLFAKATEDVARGIRLTLTDSMRIELDERQQVNPEAYREYLLGLKLLQNQNIENVEEAISRLRRAIDLDPDFVDAYGQLAVAMSQLITIGDVNRENVLAEMKTIIDQGNSIDSDNGNMINALIAFEESSLRFSESEDLILNMIKALPNDPDGYMLYFFLKYETDRDLAKEYLKKAYSLDPLDPSVARSYAYIVLREEGKYDEVIEVFDQIIEAYPNNMTNVAFKAWTVSEAPYSDLPAGFLELFHNWKGNQKSEILIRYLMDLSIELNWPEFTDYMKAEFEKYFSENRELYRYKIFNAMWSGDYEKADSLYVIKEQKFGDFRKSEPYLRANILYGLGNYEGALDELRVSLPNIGNPDSIATHSILDIGYYAFMLNKSGQNESALFYTNYLCGETEKLLNEIEGYDFYAYNRHSYCLAASGDYLGFLDHMNKIIFEYKDGAGLVRFFGTDSIYKELASKEVSQDLIRSIVEQRTILREEVIDFLKENGDWKEVWNPKSSGYLK